MTARPYPPVAVALVIFTAGCFTIGFFAGRNGLEDAWLLSLGVTLIATAVACQHGRRADERDARFRRALDETERGIVERLDRMGRDR